jgi:hypothetical protein
VSKSGAGTLASSDGLLNCGATCSHDYALGTAVTLSATPDPGSIFGAWSGTGVSCSGLAGCTVTVNATMAVTASFRAITPITDQRTLAIPNPGVYPAKGKVTVDPATGFNVVRVADKSELTGDYGGHQSTQSEIVYSRYTPSNTTGEFVLVHGDNSTSAWVYRVADNALMTILRFNPSQGSASRALGEVNELRWDYSGKFPYRLYFVGNSIGGTAQAGENIGMSLYYTDLNPTSGQQSTPVLVHDFSKDFPAFAKGSIMNDVEGDSSVDSRYWAWQIMDTSRSAGFLPFAIFTYDKQTNTVTSSLQRSCSGSLVPCVAVSTPATASPYLSRPNMVEMSPLGTRVVVDWGRVYTGNRDADLGSVADGPKAFLPNFSDPIRIGADETHSGWAWGLNGEELFVSQNDRNDWIEAVNIASSTTANCTLISDNSYTCGTKIAPYSLLDGGTWTMGMHFGKFYDPAKRGLVYVSTYDNSSANWGHNQNVLIAVNDYSVKPSTVFRLGSSYNLHFDYRSEGSGALDFAGNNIWVTANWGFSDGRGDVFRVQFPQSWTTIFH